MALRKSTVVPLVLTILVLILFPTQGQDVGDGCNVDNSPGVCKFLRDCAVVYKQLIAGISPSSICGFKGFDPIVCCPTKPINKPSPPPTPTPTPTPTPQSITVRTSVKPKLDGSRGALARAKCAEAIKELWGLEIPPTLGINKTPVNVSRCAIKTRKLIVGGTKAEPKEFPHMAAIGYENPETNEKLWLCGGSLISSKVVLTAAHCLSTLDWGDAKWVQVGILNLRRTNENTQTIRIQERIKYPEYKTPSQYHDIAILRLETEVEYSAWVRPACLPVDLPDEGTDNKAVATGWGRVDWSEESGSDDLLKVTLNLVGHDSCNASFYDGGTSVDLPRGIVNEWQLCAGEENKDTCQGDSGGPLAIFNTINDCVYNIIGVTSLGRACGIFTPGVYTRVYNYIPWIERTAWPEYF